MCDDERLWADINSYQVEAQKVVAAFERFEDAQYVEWSTYSFGSPALEALRSAIKELG